MIKEKVKPTRFEALYHFNRNKKKQIGFIKQIPKNQFKATNDDWVFQKASQTAGYIGYDSDRNCVKLGVPKIDLTIYPKQSARLPSGWRSKSIPSGNVQHIVPIPELLSHGIITNSQTHTSPGNEIVYYFYNDNNYPVKIQTNVSKGKQTVKLCRLHKQTHQIQLQFDCWHVVEMFLQVAIEVIPIILA